MTEQEINDKLPIIPHMAVADTDCIGCLVVGINGDKREVICNECGRLVAFLPADEVGSYFQKLFESTR